jgi:hypothetical protein
VFARGDPVNQLAPIAAATRLPALIAVAGERATLRFIEFFTANIRNPHTRQPHGRAVAEFLAWCDDQSVVDRRGAAVSGGTLNRSTDCFPTSCAMARGPQG